jgi:hypothetical protein
MAGEQEPDRDQQANNPPTKPDQKQAQGRTTTSTQSERDRQNRDDPSRAPESGDRK